MFDYQEMPVHIIMTYSHFVDNVHLFYAAPLLALVNSFLIQLVASNYVCSVIGFILCKFFMEHPIANCIFDRVSKKPQRSSFSLRGDR